MLAILSDYWKKLIKDYPPIKGDKLQREMLSSGKKEQIERVCLGYLKQVFGLAYKFAKNSQDLDDLMQEGYMGVMTAASKFDPLYKNKFHTYCTYWIKEAIYSQSYNRLVRIPTAKWRLVQRYKKLEEKMTVNGIVPKYEEVITHMELKGRQKKDLWLALQQPFSASGSYEESETEMLSWEPESSINVVEDICKNEEYEKFLQLYKTQLTDQERLILEMRLKKLSRRAISEELGLNQNKIAQIEQKAIGVLKAGLTK